jgi:GntR family transcriptional regulator
MKLAKGSTPLYVQAENELRSRINSGKISLNNRITAKELCKEFGVSNITIYRVLKTLANEGLIRVEPGRKTVVVSKEENKFVRIIGSIADIIAYAHETKYKLLEMRTVESDEKISRLLNINVGSKLINFIGIRLLKNVPFAFINSCLIYEIGSSIAKKDFLSYLSILSLMEDKIGIQITKCEQMIKTALVKKEAAKLLNMKVGSPILWIERLYYSDKNIPIFFSITQFNAEIYPYRINLLRGFK